MTSILSAILLWSSLGIVIRASGAPVHLLIFYSCLISTGIAGIALAKNRFRHEIPKGKALCSFLLLGPLNLMNTFSFYYAYRNTTIANAILTHYTAPLFVAFLAPLLLRERLTARILLSVALATFGLWLLLGLPSGRFAEMAIVGDRKIYGILAGLFSGFAYALLIIVSKVFTRNTHPLVMTFFQNIVIVFLLLPFAGVLKVSSPPLWTLAIMGIVHSTAAPILYFRGLREVSAERAAILGYLEPVCAIILGALFLGESLRYSSALGGTLILFSGYLTMREPS